MTISIAKVPVKNRDKPMTQITSLPSEYIDTLVYSSILMDELSLIAECASKRGLRSILLKGAAFIVNSGETYIVRPMTDVDMLIKVTEYAQWCEIFIENKYTALPYSRSAFVKSSSIPVVFDLHTSLRFITSDIIDTAWKNSIQVTYNRKVYELLPIEINILYLCLHMTVTHGYKSEKWINDINSILCVNAPLIDWNILFNYAIKCFAAAPLLATLQHLRVNNTTLIPEPVLEILKAHASTVTTRIFSYTLKKQNGIPFFEYIAPLLLHDTFNDQCQIIRKKLFPPVNEMMKRYCTLSKTIAVAMYPVRFISLIWKGSCGAMHAIISLVKNLPFIDRK